MEDTVARLSEVPIYRSVTNGEQPIETNDESAYKRGSVVEILHAVAIHLSGLPGDIGRAARLRLDLAPGGVYRARPVTGSAGALLPHRFTLTCSPKGHRRSVFCGTFLRVTPTCCWQAPCPLEPRLSSAPVIAHR